MKTVWALQDAKNRFGELVAEAERNGPQVVTRRGKEIVVVLSIDGFREFTATHNSLVTFFRNSPLVGVDLDLMRNEDYGRSATYRIGPSSAIPHG
jgi:prevent-host-death family protein